MEKKEITLGLRFAEIKVVKYSQFDLEQDFNEANEPLIEFQSNFQFRVDEPQEHLICVVTIRILIAETKELFAELKVENIFDVKPFNDIIKVNEDGHHDIPTPLLHNLISISVSTVRGIISEKLKGTFAQKEVYPLVNLSDLTKSGVK